MGRGVGVMVVLARVSDSRGMGGCGWGGVCRVGRVPGVRVPSMVVATGRRSRMSSRSVVVVRFVVCVMVVAFFSSVV